MQNLLNSIPVKQYDAKAKTVKDNKELIKELGHITDSSPSDDIQQKEDLEEENKNLLEEITTLKKEYWPLLKRLLGPSLILDWQHIVKTKANS